MELNKPAILLDSDRQALLDTHGYVVIPLIEEEVCLELKSYYEASFNDVEINSFYSSSFLKDQNLKLEVGQYIEKSIGEAVDGILGSIRKLGASYLVKPSGKKGFMPVHQDWTISDESRDASYTIWIPLQDVNSSNGCLRVLPGSHRYSATLRGPSIPVEYSAIRNEIAEYLISVPLKAGEGILFNQALMHASSENETEKPRIAIAYGLVHSDCELKFHHLDDKNNEMMSFSIPDDFFLRYLNIGGIPDFVKHISSEKWAIQEWKKKDFLQKYDQFTTPLIEKPERMNDSQDSTTIKLPLFSNPEQQKAFEEDGFVICPVLNSDEVGDLKTFYDSLDNDHIPDYGFHVSMDKGDPEFVKKVIAKVKGVVYPRLKEKLADHRVITASYVGKEPNPVGVVPPHQDWTFVDESKYDSATVWIPLQDVNMENGAIGLIHGSQKFFDYIRCSPSPQAKTPLSDHMFSIFPYLQIKEMKAGEALIFNNKTIHASPPNVTSESRIAVGLGITQKEASLFHHYLVPGTDPQMTEQYAIGSDFFHRHNNSMLSKMYNDGQKPEGLQVAATNKRIMPEYTSDEILDMIKSHPANVMNVPLVEKMAKLFKYNMDGSKKEDPVKEEVTESIQDTPPAPEVRTEIQNDVQEVKAPLEEVIQETETPGLFRRILNALGV